MTDTGIELNLLEVLFWVTTVVLVSLTVGATSYQLITLYFPYWLSRDPFSFPPYFYRVYGAIRLPDKRDSG
jgi:hypothetical protein